MTRQIRNLKQRILLWMLICSNTSALTLLAYMAIAHDQVWLGRQARCPAAADGTMFSFALVWPRHALLIGFNGQLVPKRILSSALSQGKDRMLTVMARFAANLATVRLARLCRV